MGVTVAGDGAVLIDSPPESTSGDNFYSECQSRSLPGGLWHEPAPKIGRLTAGTENDRRSARGRRTDVAAGSSPGLSALPLLSVGGWMAHLARMEVSGMALMGYCQCAVLPLRR